MMGLSLPHVIVLALVGTGVFPRVTKNRMRLIWKRLGENYSKKLALLKSKLFVHRQQSKGNIIYYA